MTASEESALLGIFGDFNLYASKSTYVNNACKYCKKIII